MVSGMALAWYRPARVCSLDCRSWRAAAWNCPTAAGSPSPGDADGFAEVQRGEVGGDDVAGVHRG